MACAGVKDGGGRQRRRLTREPLRPGGYGSGEDASIMRQVRTLMAENREPWFPDWDRVDSNDTHRPNAGRGVGWRKVVKDAAGDVVDTEYFCLLDPFRSMLCEGLDAERVPRLLKERGHLVPATDGHLARMERLPGLGRKRCYRIKSSIFDDVGDE